MDCLEQCTQFNEIFRGSVGDLSVPLPVMQGLLATIARPVCPFVCVIILEVFQIAIVNN